MTQNIILFFLSLPSTPCKTKPKHIRFQISYSHLAETRKGKENMSCNLFYTHGREPRRKGGGGNKHQHMQILRMGNIDDTPSFNSSPFSLLFIWRCARRKRVYLLAWLPQSLPKLYRPQPLLKLLQFGWALAEEERGPGESQRVTTTQRSTYFIFYKHTFQQHTTW